MIKIGGLVTAQQPEATVDGEYVIILVVIILNIYTMMTMIIIIINRWFNGCGLANLNGLNLPSGATG